MAAHVVKQGRMLDAQFMSRQIKAVTRRDRRVSAILVFRDSEGADPAKTLLATRLPLQILTQAHPKMTIDYVVVDHSLEGWLLSDPEALRTVLGPRVRIALPARPDTHPRPAELMSRVFAANGLDYAKMRHAPRMAEAADTTAIASRSPTFAALVSLLKLL